MIQNYFYLQCDLRREITVCRLTAAPQGCLTAAAYSYVTTVIHNTHLQLHAEQFETTWISFTESPFKLF